MVDNMLDRARKFIGLSEERGSEVEEEEKQETKREDIREVLRPKRTREKVDAEFEIMVYEPKVYEDSLQMSAALRQGCPVIINLAHLDQTEGTRLIDFVCGTAYAIDGHMIKIGESIFLFTPKSIVISDNAERGSIEQDIDTAEAARKSFFGN